MLTRRALCQNSALAALALLLGGCNSQEDMRAAEALLESGESIPWDRLLAEAHTEGALTTIALPHDWANYGEIIRTVRERYGLRIMELNPAAGSGEELEAVEQSKTAGDGEGPDVLDIGLGFTETAKEQGLLARYKVASWATIPENARDPEGYWCGNYYGVLAFEANLALVKNAPLDWPDLLRPEYKNRVALAGDPTVSSQAIYSVWAAGLSRTNSLDEAPQAGLEFFAELNRIGNFVPIIADVNTIAAGDTPITIQWDYLGLSNRDTLKGKPDVAVVIPETGILAGLYAQAISSYAPHPFAARLWTEFLFSDEGQLLWLEGYVHPIRYNELVASYKVPLELAAKLPPAASYAQALFPTIPQITNAQKIITEGWSRVVLGS